MPDLPFSELTNCEKLNMYFLLPHNISDQVYGKAERYFFRL